MNRIKEFKSSILGAGLIIFGGVLLYKKITMDYWILGSLFAVGLGLLFSGDDFINKLENKIFGEVSFKKNDDGQPK